MYLIVLLFTSNIAIPSRGSAVRKRRVPNTTKKRSSTIKVGERVM